MKRLISLALSALTVTSLLAACAPAKEQLDPAITLASSDASGYAQWLDDRLDVIPDDVVIGIGSNTAHGVDMADFEDDGYIARAIGGEVLLFGKTAAGLDRAVREYAKAADASATAELDTVYHDGVRIEKLTIAGRDISEFKVVYSKDLQGREMMNPGWACTKTAGNAEYASGEFIRLIKQATGVTLEMTDADSGYDGPMIRIDFLTDGSCGENGFTYKVENGNLYINGAPDANGCTNGVYYFLQYECGWDELLFGDSELRESDHVAIENGLSKTVDPIFDYFLFKIPYIFDFKNDRDYEGQSYRGIIEHACHGMANYEWAGMTAYHVNTLGRVCHTDENIYATVFDKIYTYVKIRQNAGQIIGEDITTIDISQGDNLYHCMCTGCAKVYREEGKAHAGAVLRFANRLAAEMEAEGKGGLVYQIFAYHGSNNPPSKTVARSDVFVTFVNDGCCANHPLNGSECFGKSFDMAGMIVGMESLNNNDYAAWIKGWGEICENVYLWHYGMPHNFGTYTYYQNIYSDMMYLKSAGIRGFYLEGEYNGLGFARLRSQLMNVLVWNPDITEEEYNLLRDEIMEREYGEGYEYIQDYIDILETTEAGGDRCWNCWGYGNLFNAGNWDVEMFYNRSDECLELLYLALSKTSTGLQDQLIKTLITEVLYRQCAIGYFEAFDTNDTEAIDALQEKYLLCLKTGYEAGFSGLWPNGFSAYALVVQPTIEEAAWITWKDYREDLNYNNREMREMPQKWIDWYETSGAETSAS